MQKLPALSRMDRFFGKTSIGAAAVAHFHEDEPGACQGNQVCLQVTRREVALDCTESSK